MPPGQFAKPTVVIPTFNEYANLSGLFARLLSLSLPGLRVLVVDDASPDGTGQLAESLAKDYPGQIAVIHRSGKLGLGSAYVTGFKEAVRTGADAIVQMDADFSHPPELLPQMLDALERFDVVMGSRYVKGGSLDERWPAWRKGLSAFGNLYARTILRLPVQDATGGFRAWRRETLVGMPLERIRSNGYAFQIEMAYVAYRLGFSFLEIPFYFADRKWGISKMSLSIQIEAAKRVWQMLIEYRDLERVHHSCPGAIHS